MTEANVAELENGIFNLTISLIKAHISAGLPTRTARDKVAELLEQYANAIKSISNT